MEKKTNFIKVRTFVIIKEGDKISISDNGTFNGSDAFVEKVNNYSEKFRAAIITFINDVIGLHNWAVTFTPFSDDGSIYDVKIYSDNEDNDGVKIKNIIEERITDRELKFSYGGTINDYPKIP